MHLCRMWYNKNKVCEKLTELKLISQSEMADGFLDIEGSHSLGEIAAKGASKGLYNLGRVGVSKAIKSDFAKQKIKGIANEFLDQA